MNTSKITATAVALSTIAGVALQAQERPNILFIFTDDHSKEAISAYGSTLIETPNLDRIADEGALMLNNTVCNSICGPSRAAILTGKHSHMNGKIDNIQLFDPSQPTFPVTMQENGYNTAIVGKWHLDGDPHGFDYWEITPGQGSYINPDFYGSNGKRRVNGHNTDVVTDMAMDWISEVTQSNDEPFYLMCQYKAPHRSWVPAERHYDLYDDVNFPIPDRFYEDLTDKPAYYTENEMRIDDHMLMDFDLKIPRTGIKDSLGRTLSNLEYKRMTLAQKKKWNDSYRDEVKNFKKNHKKWSEKELAEWKYQRYMRDYLGCIAGVDENVGRLLEFLEESGLRENTIVVYSSDQGFYLGERGWYDKRWMYHESLSMPFLISWPGKIEAGKVFTELTQNIDFGPTFLEFAGLPIDEKMQGESFAKLLTGTGSFDRNEIYYHYYEMDEHNVPRHEGVMNHDAKLISFYDFNAWELYDLKNDPEETNNLYGKAENEELQAKMHDLLDTVKEKYEVVK